MVQGDTGYIIEQPKQGHSCKAGSDSQSRPRDGALDMQYVIDRVNDMRGEVSIGVCLALAR